MGAPAGPQAQRVLKAGTGQEQHQRLSDSLMATLVQGAGGDGDQVGRDDCGRHGLDAEVQI
jgi:hypothetical protein